MKHIISIITIIILSAITFTANAQYANRIHRDKMSFVTDKGVRLSDNELIDIIGMDTFSETVIGARDQYHAGCNLIWGGSLALFSGIICLVNDVPDSDFGAFLTSTFIYGGCATIDAGIVLFIIGKSRLNWVESYANSKNYSVNVGPTSNGFGISMKF